MNFSLENQYLNLGEGFYEAATPASVPEPKLLLWNDQLATELNLPPELINSPSELAQYFSGNQTFTGSTPIALAYAGHQFGHFNPQLGDGRAHLLGDCKLNGHRVDVQLKGSGQTPFSRRGDGLCGLGPAVREFIMSEAMHALGVPTSRALAVVTTGDQVYRQTLTPGAVVTRVAASHLRVGTFELFKSRGDFASVEKLCDFAIQRHYPQLNELSGKERYLGFLEAVFAKHIVLVCHWMRVGFIHGVMNTDNTAISGETIDYGPCAMMNAYDPNTVFSSIDDMGRYRFGHQPQITHWNLARLTECLLPLIDPDTKKAISIAEALLSQFVADYHQRYYPMMGAKIGLATFTQDDQSLVNDLLKRLEEAKADYTNTFNQLTNSLGNTELSIELKTILGDWLDQWQQRLAQQGEDSSIVMQRMRAQNPVVIPRNHQVEAVIADCIETGSAEKAEALLAVLKTPYEETEHTAQYQSPPEDGDQHYRTFCGT